MNNMKNPKRRNIRWDWIIGIGGIAFLSVWLFTWFNANSPTASDDDVGKKGKIEERGKKRIREAKEPKRERDNKEYQNAVTNGKFDAGDAALRTNPPREMVKVSTNSFGQVNELYRTLDGRLHRRIYNARKPIFDNAADQLLSMAVNARPGARIAPMPNMRNGNIEETFLKALETPIRIDPDDSDEIRERKRRVATAREEMREMMAEGYSFAEALNAHRDSVNDSHTMRNDALKILKDLVAEGDSELAHEYLKKANELLRNSGIDEISMPSGDDDEE